MPFTNNFSYKSFIKTYSLDKNIKYILQYIANNKSEIHFDFQQKTKDAGIVIKICKDIQPGYVNIHIQFHSKYSDYMNGVFNTNSVRDLNKATRMCKQYMCFWRGVYGEIDCKFEIYCYVSGVDKASFKYEESNINTGITCWKGSSYHRNIIKNFIEVLMNGEKAIVPSIDKYRELNIKANIQTRYNLRPRHVI